MNMNQPTLRFSVAHTTVILLSLQKGSQICPMLNVTEHADQIALFYLINYHLYGLNRSNLFEKLIGSIRNAFQLIFHKY